MDKVIPQLREAAGADFVAMYLVGSYGTAYQIDTSDMDLILVHVDDMPAETMRKVMAARDRLREITGERVDVRPMTLSFCLQHAFSLKQVGRFLAGDDVRDRIREQTVEEQARRLTSAALMFVRRAHNLPADAMIDPQRLDYPDREDPFCGYLDRSDPLPLHRLMSLSFLASARLALKAGVVPPTKHDIPALYREHFNDGTEAFVSALFTRVRGEWHYRIPTDPGDRDALAEICKQALQFERVICGDLVEG